jgi:SAM-dependent methyltransferase
MPTSDYVHGYSLRESQRLLDQSNVLEALLHRRRRYQAGDRVLEVGCGVGAQTVALARDNPEASFVSCDVSRESLSAARARVAAAGLGNVRFEEADIFALPFDDAAFDHVFVCFVLEHLTDPERAVRALLRVLAPGGTLTVIEGDHGSVIMHPDSAMAHRTIEALVELQRRAGGNANIGRSLYPLLVDAGVADVRVELRTVYADASHPERVQGFTLDTFTAMVRGVRESALAAGLIDPATFNSGISALERAATRDGTFTYTFFEAVGRRDATDLGATTRR